MPARNDILSALLYERLRLGAVLALILASLVYLVACLHDVQITQNERHANHPRKYRNPLHCTLFLTILKNRAPSAPARSAGATSRVISPLARPSRAWRAM